MPHPSIRTHSSCEQHPRPLTLPPGLVSCLRPFPCSILTVDYTPSRPHHRLWRPRYARSPSFTSTTRVLNPLPSDTPRNIPALLCLIKVYKSLPASPQDHVPLPSQHSHLPFRVNLSPKSKGLTQTDPWSPSLPNTATANIRLPSRLNPNDKRQLITPLFAQHQPRVRHSAKATPPPGKSRQDTDLTRSFQTSRATPHS